MDLIARYSEGDKDQMGRFYVVGDGKEIEIEGVVDATWTYELIEGRGRWGINHACQHTGKIWLTLTLHDGTTITGYDVTNERNGEDMSSNLFWRPGGGPGKSIGLLLAGALRNYYGDNLQPAMVLTSFDTNMLRAMHAAGLSDAQVLIDAIKEHESVTISCHRTK